MYEKDTLFRRKLFDNIYQCFKTLTDPTGWTGRPANRRVRRFRKATGPDMQLTRWNSCDLSGSVDGPLNQFSPPNPFFHFFLIKRHNIYKDKNSSNTYSQPKCHFQPPFSSPISTDEDDEYGHQDYNNLTP